MKRFFMATLLFILFGASGTEANSKSGTINNPNQISDTIIVSTNRFPTSIEKNANSITVLTEADISKNQTAMVSDLLKQVPGLDVVRSGGVGTQTSVFMRGTNSNHTLVIIDGVEMNNPSSATTSFDFGTLNVSNIQRIEILRGPQSVLYGSDAVGGVIQIFTKRGYGDLKTEISSEAGSYNSFTESIHLSGSEGKIDFSLFGSRKDSKGFSTIRSDAGGDEKDGFESTDIITNIGFQLPKSYELTFNSRYTDTKTDIDGFGFILDDPNNISENKINSTGVRLKKYKTKNKYFKPSVNFTLSNQELKSTNEIDEMHPNDASESNSTGKRMKVSASNQMNIYENVNSIIGIEYEKETFNSDYNSLSMWGPFSDTISEVSASTFSLYGLDDWSINEQFSLSGGLRYDDHEDFGSQITYRFTSLYKIHASGLSLKATIGTAFKAPSLYQLNHSIYGNRDLQPEENLGWEIGFEKSSPDNILKFGATYFSNEIDNMIGYDAMFVSINIDEATSEGVEAFAQISSQKSSIRINLTYTDVKNKTNQSKILRRPKEKISLNLNHQFSNTLQANLMMQSIGNRFDTDFRPWPYQDVVLQGYTVVNISTIYKILDKVNVTARIDNLFDEDYQDVLTYNTPNRSGFVGLKITL